MSNQSALTQDSSEETAGCRILVVEDNTTDYELMVRELRKSELDVATRRVATKQDFLSELAAFSPHLVCTDFRLPGFTGLDIVRLAKVHAPLLPVIVVTGTLPEEDAADSIKAGATDYVVKERLFRLLPAVRGALDRRREGEELQDARRRFERSESRALALLNAARDGVALLDREGTVLETNQPCADNVQSEVGTLVGDCLWDHMGRAQAAFYRDLVGRVFGSGEPTRTETCHNGTWQDVTVHPVRSAAGGVDRVAVFLRDITEHKRNQAELERLGTAVAQADEAFVITDAKGAILYVNPAFETISGYTRAEAVGKSSGIVKSGTHDDSFYDGLWRVIKRGKTWKGRLTNRRKSGETYQVDATISPVTDSTGQIVNYVAVKRDVTREVELEAQVIRHERLQALGKMVSGIAHDFNNIMTPILGLAEEMLSSPESMAQPEQVQACLRQISSSASDARDIVRRLREFYRPGDDVERGPVDIAEIAAEALALTRPAWGVQSQAVGKSVIVRNQVGKLPPAMGNAPQLRELLVNLLLNATDAITESGEILVEAETRGPRLFLSVRDTGVGMDAEQVARCLEPFYSTKGERGSGLGLAMAYGIAKQHGGDLRIQSTRGQGTTVAVTLPICRGGQLQPPAPAPAPALPPVGPLRILLADDEPLALSVMRRVFERMGHDVTAAPSGGQALLELGTGDFGLLVTDRAMPDMSGDEVAARAKETHPDLPIIMLTGFGDLMNYARETPPGVDLVVSKPASPQDLAEAIAQVVPA